MNNNYFEKMEKSNISINLPSSSGSSKNSVSIVYSNNGKRMTISKSIVERLKLSKTVCICPLVEDNVIILGANLPKGKSVEAKLSGEDKKIVYLTSIIKHIVYEYKLDYSECSSLAFANITFEKKGDQEIAIVDLSTPTKTKGSSKE